MCTVKRWILENFSTFIDYKLMKDKLNYFFNFIKSPLTLRDKKDFFYLIDGALIIFLPSVIIYNILLINSSASSRILASPKLSFAFFIYVLLIAPILEELIFRLSLKKIKRNLILSILSCVIYLFIRYSYFETFSEVDVFLLMLMGYFLLNIAMGSTKLVKFNFYFLNFIFAFLHVFNYKLDSEFILVYLFGILNYLILALIFSYYRIYYSFKANLMMHVFYNFLSIFPIVLSKL